MSEDNQTNVDTELGQVNSGSAQKQDHTEINPITGQPRRKPKVIGVESRTKPTGTPRQSNPTSTSNGEHEGGGDGNPGDSPDEGGNRTLSGELLPPSSVGIGAPPPNLTDGFTEITGGSAELTTDCTEEDREVRQLRRLRNKAVRRGLDLTDAIDDHLANTIKCLLHDSMNMKLKPRDRRGAAQALAKLRKDLVDSGKDYIFNTIVQAEGDVNVGGGGATEGTIIRLPSNGRD